MTLRERYMVWKAKRECKKISKKAHKMVAKFMKKYEKTGESLRNLRNSL